MALDGDKSGSSLGLVQKSDPNDGSKGDGGMLFSMFYVRREVKGGRTK